MPDPAPAPIPTRDPSLPCECCRRQREGLAPSAPCPECGVTPSGYPVVAVEPPPNRCAGCGYSIEELRPDGLCPECGLPITETLQGDGLHLAPPDYLNRLIRGTRWILRPLLAFACCFVISLCLQPLGAVVMLAGVPTLLLSTSYGMVLFTSSDPRFDPEGKRTPPSRRVRDCAILLFVLTLVALVALPLMFATQTPENSEWHTTITVLVLSAIWLVFGLLLMLGMGHARVLARRMHKKRIAREAVSAQITIAVAMFSSLAASVGAGGSQHARLGIILICITFASNLMVPILVAAVLSKLNALVDGAIARQLQLSAAPGVMNLPSQHA